MKLSIHLHPKASKRKAVVKNGQLEIYVHSPPEKNKANKELTTHTAKALGLAKSKVILSSGHKSRKKVLELLELNTDVTTVQKKLEESFC